MVPPVPTAQKRNLLSDHVFHQEDLFAPATLALLDMPHGMCPYLEDHSLGLPRLLGRLSGGTSLRLRHPGDALNLRLLLLLWCSGSMLASHARGPGFNPRAG